MEKDIEKEVVRQAVVHSIFSADKETYDFDVEYGNKTGNFSVKLASLMDSVAIGVNKAKLSQGLVLDVISDNILHMTATLREVVISAPKWFNLDTLKDYLLLETVYDEYIKWADSFRSPLRQDEDKGDSRNTVTEETVEG